MTEKQEKPRVGPFSFGRSERIRTSDPCLPKTVLYQAELHSDRAGGRSAKGPVMQALCHFGGVTFSRGCVRGDVPMDGRDFVRRTGVVADRPPKVSRSTM